MNKVVDEFRKKLSEKLKVAMANRSKEEVGTLRSIMSALDNAGALTKDEISRLVPGVTEVPRKNVGKPEIEQILESEIQIRSLALGEFEKIGNYSQADVIRKNISMIRQLIQLLGK